ncbi:hypothetical protein NX801_25455 [Streptomyces sp. LP05-1]|uniref:Uncharacterized protein n=1 Tax=Streptomyces pyxinae TaxID=2970734 RepID=A0ABT2CND8_9ACTN|nr:hypothetical protein [Streptomyces sp. LP05-1]MCS0638934.1 hypothetical protein [Streptomyces sp. LP05-1]
MDDKMSWKTHVDGQPVRLPSTIDEIRAALPEDQRPVFDEEIGRTPVDQLPQVLAVWALPPAAREQIDADIARLKAGDHSGFHPHSGDAA